MLAELEQQTRGDPLTGLLNRRALDEALDRECARAERHCRPLAPALLDVDNFTRINDTFSHAVGDAVLVAISACLLQSRRRSDYAARLGGEELVLVLPETTIEQALELCATVRKCLLALDWVAIGVAAPQSVTVSIGLAAGRAGETAKALLSRADALMYRAKALDKDRVEWEA